MEDFRAGPPQDPHEVANIVFEAATSDDPKLRWLAGDDARMLVPLYRSMEFEGFANVMLQRLGLTDVIRARRLVDEAAGLAARIRARVSSSSVRRSGPRRRGRRPPHPHPRRCLGVRFPRRARARIGRRCSAPSWRCSRAWPMSARSRFPATSSFRRAATSAVIARSPASRCGRRSSPPWRRKRGPRSSTRSLGS